MAFIQNFANNLKINGFPYIKDGVTAVIIDNSTNFEESDNYFHSLYRIKDAETIKNAFKADSAKIKLTLMSDLLGIKPKELYTIQKLKWNIAQLYTEKDAIVYYKKRYLRKDDIDEIERRSKFNKNLLLFVPEWYKWFAENKFNGVLIQNISYKYAYVTEANEYYNFYTLEYVNLFEQRPYFGKCWRTATLRKQTANEIATDARNYLFKIE